MSSRRDDGTGLIDIDPWLQPWENSLRHRTARYRGRLRDLESITGSLESFAQGHHYFGFIRGTHKGASGLWYREWAPGAEHLALVGDFNNWDRSTHAMTRDTWGVWSLFIPDGKPQPTHNSRLKVHVSAGHNSADRIPAYIRRVSFNADGSHASGVYWDPPEPYRWKHAAPPLVEFPRIYEAHVGMSSREEKVSTFPEFTRDVLPRIKAAGYDCIQLMAVAEHPYYASFGYHVSNFFAVSSRFGTPDELKALIDEAHGMGIRVIIDLVHSHSVKNTLEGLNRFDGTDHQYFHAGGRGEHPLWDSMLFDYGKTEVLRFLLSNCRYWLEEYRVDGFRFDGVTSMLYKHHGVGHTFASYDDYFGNSIDEDAVSYLQLANTLIHRLRPDALTVAEDVSGMPGLAQPVEIGGIGFDFRLAMGVPDMWIKTLKERRDEDWNLGHIYHTLTNRRHDEKHIGYAESHDQALVGDKTLAFWLMDAAMYHDMSVHSRSIQIDRGIALHKIIRLLTFALAGQGWLNFMGNEFGHPEWIDFPREGNNYSYWHARRQWNLADDDNLRYKHLAAFDRAMLALQSRFDLFRTQWPHQIMVHEEDKVLAFHRGPLVFVINLHPTRSHDGLRIGVPTRSDHIAALDSDHPDFGGHARTRPHADFPLQARPDRGMDQSVQVYLPTRSALVLAPRGLAPADDRGA